MVIKVQLFQLSKLYATNNLKQEIETFPGYNWVLHKSQFEGLPDSSKSQIICKELRNELVNI